MLVTRTRSAPCPFNEPANSSEPGDFSTGIASPVIGARFDLLPAALTTGTVLAIVDGRLRVSSALLGLGIVAKLYPAILLPVLVAAAWRRGGRRDAVRSLVPAVVKWANDELDDIPHRRTRLEDTVHAKGLEARDVGIRDDPANEHEDVIHALFAQERHQTGHDVVVRAGEDREPDHVGILLQRRRRDLLRRLAKARVDHLHAGIAHGARDDLGAAVVAIEARLRDDDSDVRHARGVSLPKHYRPLRCRGRLFAVETYPWIVLFQLIRSTR